MIELLSLENNEIKHAFEDHVLLNDATVLDTLLATEEKDHMTLMNTCNNCNVTKTEIKPFMRRIVANWMLEVRFLHLFELFSSKR